jgi:hypothetical protein
MADGSARASRSDRACPAWACFRSCRQSNPRHGRAKLARIASASWARRGDCVDVRRDARAAMPRAQRRWAEKPPAGTPWPAGGYLLAHSLDSCRSSFVRISGDGVLPSPASDLFREVRSLLCAASVAWRSSDLFLRSTRWSLRTPGALAGRFLCPSSTSHARTGSRTCANRFDPLFHGLWRYSPSAP